MRFTIEGTNGEIKEFISDIAQKPRDLVLPEGPISEHGYGEKIFQRLEEKLSKKDSVPISAQASDKDLDRIEPDHHLDVYGGVD